MVVAAMGQRYSVRPALVLGFAGMRLRTLSEAECYARIYGGHGGERVSFVRLLPRPSRSSSIAGEQLRGRFEERLDLRGPEAEAA
jgi:hypothetical protein